MRRNNKKLIAGSTALSVALTAVLTTVVASPASAATSRIGGQNRYETAALVSQQGWESGAEYAIIAKGDSFADALCAAPLAKMYKAPILLTESDKLNETTAQKLKDLKVKNVFIVGGTGAVSEEVEKEIKGIVGNVERLSGRDRYSTSVKIAEKLGTTKAVSLVTGDEYADALSMAAVAASEGMPILLTAKNNLPEEVAQYIKDNNIKITYIVGGTGAVSNSVETAVPGAIRISGQNRFETNVRVMSQFANKLNFEKVFVAVGDGPSKTEFADALSGAALAAKSGSPIVLTYNELDAEAENFIKTQITPKSDIVALGGEQVVPETIISKIKSDAKDYSAEGKVYDKENVSGNVKIDGKNVAFQNATVNGNVYVYGDAAKLSNATVKGTVFVDPGENGNVTLDGVNADNIIVLSGAKNSIHLKDVKAKALMVQSKNKTNSVRVVTEGKTVIGTTFVKTNALLDASQGTFGNIEVIKGGQEFKNVELKGKFAGTFVASGESKIVVGDNTFLPSLEVGSKNVEVATAKTSEIKVFAVNETVAGTGIKLTGEGKVTTIINESGAARLKIDEKIAVTEIFALVKGAIDAPKSILDKVSEKSASELGKLADSKIETAVKEAKPNEPATTPSTPSTGGGGGSSSGGTSGGSEDPDPKPPVTESENKDFNSFKNSIITLINNKAEIAKYLTIDNITDVNNITVSLKGNMESRSLSSLTMSAVNKIKTRPYSEAGISGLKQLMGWDAEKKQWLIKVDDKDVPTYLAGKIVAKPHGASIAAFLNAIVPKDCNAQEEYEKLQAKLNQESTDTYDELVAMIKETISFSDGASIKLPQDASVKGLKLTKIDITKNNVTIATVNNGGTISLKAVKEALEITSETKLENVKNISIKVTMTGNSGTNYYYTISLN